MNDKDKDWAEQLQEGYDYLDKKSEKTGFAMLQKIVDACDILEAEGKANLKRKVKLKSPQDLVKKLKFKQSDTNFGLASVDQVISIHVSVVFNTKNPTWCLLC